MAQAIRVTFHQRQTILSMKEKRNVHYLKFVSLVVYSLPLLFLARLAVKYLKKMADGLCDVITFTTGMVNLLLVC